MKKSDTVERRLDFYIAPRVVNSLNHKAWSSLSACFFSVVRQVLTPGSHHIVWYYFAYPVIKSAQN